MKVLSVSNSGVNPYKVGLQIGTELSKISPEFVLTFPCINFEPFDEYLEGLYDGLNDPSVLVLGGTGDGYFEKDQVKEVGSTALAINSEGRIRYQFGAADISPENSEESAYGLAKDIVSRLKSDKTKLLFCFSDYRADGSAVGRGLAKATDLPIVGGFFGQHLTGFYCYGFMNKAVSQNKMFIVSLEGDFSFDIGFASGWEKVGEGGVVTKMDRNVLIEIDGLPAMDFFEKQTGIPAGTVFERGIVAIKAESPTHIESEYEYIRAIDQIHQATGGVSLLGGVNEGDLIYICQGNQESILKAAANLADRIRSQAKRPEGALVISCAGRKKLLGPRVVDEIQGISESFRNELPLAGFPSFGELAPLVQKDGSYHNLYHNMTVVLLTISDGL